MPDRIRVTSAEFIRNIGYWKERALEHPISITHHGRERLVLASSAQFAALTAATADAANQEQSAALARTTVAHRELLDHISEGYIVVDPALRYVRLNHAARLFFGVEEEQIVGKVMTELLPSVAGAVIHREVLRVLEAKVETTFESDSIAAPGQRLLFTLYPHPDGVAILFRNITELHRLKQQAEFARALSCAADASERAAILGLSPQGVIESVGESFLAWTGFPKDALLQARFADVLTPASKAVFVGSVRRAIETRAPTSCAVTVVGRSRETDVHIGLSPIMDGFVVAGLCLCVSLSADLARQPNPPPSASP